MPSTRRAEATMVKTRRNTRQDENAVPKVCKPPLKSKNINRNQKRPALADKTNSGSDLNQSTSISSNDGVVNVSCSDRPKRKQNLPAKFMDHEVSPIVFRHKILPGRSSTPLSVKKTRTKQNISKVEKSPPIEVTPSKISTNKSTTTRSHSVTPVKPILRANTRSRAASVKSTKTNSAPKIVLLTKKKESNVKENTAIKVIKTPSIPNVSSSGVKIFKNITPIYKKQISPKKPVTRTDNPLALYEFEFDPTEEPTKQKKKRIRKKVVNPSKKKQLENISKDNAAMKKLVEELKKIQEAAVIKKLASKKKMQRENFLQLPSTSTVNFAQPMDSVSPQPSSSTFPMCTNPPEMPSGTTRVYSPRPPTPLDPIMEDDYQNDDRFEDAVQSTSLTVPVNNSKIHSMSGFSDRPIANSSMINTTNSRTPASPWRVDYGTEVKKWPYNFYVKSSMTPAYQRDTFHILGLDDDPNNTTYMDKTVPTETPVVNAEQPTEEPVKATSNWKQTSILSFYEESFKKTSKKRSHSPKKAPEQYNFDEYSTPSTSSIDTSLKENSNPGHVTPVKSPPKTIEIPAVQNPTVENCFGFDDSAEFDQENISPIKIKKIQNINTVRGSGMKTRVKKVGVLQEINQIVSQSEKPRPMRMVALRNKNKENVVIPEKIVCVEKPIEISVQVNQDSSDESVNESQLTDSIPESSGTSQNDNTGAEVALFEDLIEPEIVHFNKPSRRSYEKRKRPMVRFRQEEDHSGAESVHSDQSETEDGSSKATKKKVKKKKKSVKTKKAEKEADEWAAGFNSMLEEVDDFDLVIE